VASTPAAGPDALRANASRLLRIARMRAIPATGSAERSEPIDVSSPADNASPLGREVSAKRQRASPPAPAPEAVPAQPLGSVPALAPDTTPAKPLNCDPALAAGRSEPPNVDDANPLSREVSTKRQRASTPAPAPGAAPAQPPGNAPAPALAPDTTPALPEPLSSGPALAPVPETAPELPPSSAAAPAEPQAVPAQSQGCTPAHEAPAQPAGDTPGPETAQEDGETVVVRCYDIRITVHDLRTLKAGAWMNDQVIDAYLALIQARSLAPAITPAAPSTTRPPTVRALPGTFWATLITRTARGAEWMPRWLEGENLLSYDVIVVPVHLPRHWSILVVNLALGEITHYDPYTPLRPNTNVIDRMVKFLATVRAREPANPAARRPLRISQPSGPTQPQTDLVECGAFVCAYAARVARCGRTPAWPNDWPDGLDAGAFRAHISEAILKLSIDG
jgi:hypothetical protein